MGRKIRKCVCVCARVQRMFSRLERPQHDGRDPDRRKVFASWTGGRLSNRQTRDRGSERIKGGRSRLKEMLSTAMKTKNNNKNQDTEHQDKKIFFFKSFQFSHRNFFLFSSGGSLGRLVQSIISWAELNKIPFPIFFFCFERVVGFSLLWK